MRKNNRFKNCWLFLFVLLFGISLTWAQTDTGQTKLPHSIPRVTEKIKVDGSLDEKVWEQALVMELKYEVDPGENIEPPVKTEVLLVYGGRDLYIAFRAYDPDPTQIRAHVTDRDNIDNDDWVGVALDTFNDSRRAYAFLVNPLGIQSDFINTTFVAREEWDGIWKSSGKLYDWGYVVEIEIPFNSLRFQKSREDQIWGIDAVRSFPRSLVHTIGLFPRNRSNNCYMCQAEKIVGFKGASPGLNLEFDPTLSYVMTQERESFPDGDFAKTTDKVDPGITARWSMTPNLTLNAAVNPDFSHVEADAAQLDVNNQFALFFPEKRPFFLEGRNVFSTRFFAVHTRSLVDPDWGVKLTGKEGNHSIGYFTVQDSLTNLMFASSESTEITTLNMNSISSVLRYRLDVGRASQVGLLLTDREGENYFNRVGGIDGDIRFSRTERLLFQYLGSQTRYPGEVVETFGQPDGKFTGGALDAFYQHLTQHVQIFAHYQHVTPLFRADVGFVDQTGLKVYEGGGGYTWREQQGHWFTRIDLWSGYSKWTNEENNMLQEIGQVWLNYFGPLQSAMNFHATVGKRSYLGQEFDHNTMDVTFQLRPSGSVFLWLIGMYGDQVDFVNFQAGQRIRINPGIQINAGRRFALNIDHLYEKLDVDAGKLYSANLSNIGIVFQFTRRAFLRAILQYADFRYNTENYVRPRDPEYRHLFSQILFSYKINPQTVLFLGYSDDYYGFSVIPVTQNNRTFFLKIGYALVL